MRSPTKSQWRVLQNLSLTCLILSQQCDTSLSGVCYKISLLQMELANVSAQTVSVACATKSLSYKFQQI